MTIVLGSLVVILTFAVGALIAFLFSRLDRAVVSNNAAMELEERAYNPALTMGYKINSMAPADEQVMEARKQAAKQAAALPRGANMKIGYEATPERISASTGVETDPWTASKIAEFHGWDGARTGIPAGGVPTAPPAAVAAPAAGGKIELVPGKDYPVIEITDDMSPDDKRKARIANSKAKSAAMKAAKAAGVPAAAAAAAAPVAAAPVAAAPVGIEPPALTTITDDMSPDEVRKARIANSKAKSAFNKALKAAGIDPKTVELDEDGNIVMPAGAAPVAAAQAPVAPAGAPAAGADFASLGIEPPQLVVITDDLSPDEIRKARINNSKAKSAFNKALKAAGIDPQTVEIGDDGSVTMSGGQAPVAAAPAPAEAAAAPAGPAATEGEVDLAALGLTPPELIEITDEMSPDETRQARIANSKAKSAFNKALKAAGIDPKSVNY